MYRKTYFYLDGRLVLMYLFFNPITTYSRLCICFSLLFIYAPWCDMEHIMLYLFVCLSAWLCIHPWDGSGHQHNLHTVLIWGGYIHTQVAL